jgi:monofunctional biosynthetic peptidoglycan transglycosylase
MRARAAERGEPAPSPARTDLDAIAPLLACAVVQAEDRDFFAHDGVVWSRLRAATFRWLGGDSSRGGSTITQQLAKNLYLSERRTAGRKLREALLARRLEHALDKRRILELYLNTIELGDGVWGVGDAAHRYFGRGAGELDAFEASFLASLIAAPRQPLTGKNRRRAFDVQRRVLDGLYLGGLVDGAAWRAGLARAIVTHARLLDGASLEAALAPTEKRGERIPLPGEEQTLVPPAQMFDERCGTPRIARRFAGSR